MASHKTGFSYYNVDTDRYQDIKIKRLKKDLGCSGIAVYDYILSEIYRVRGCFIEWDSNTAFDVADYFGIKESLVIEIVNYCCNVGLFDKALLTGENVLSSVSIQKRYLDMCGRAKRSNAVIPEEYNIIQEDSPIVPEESTKQSEGSPQSRVENSKVKKSKEELYSLLVARKQKFALTLESFSSQYPREMLVDFYKYWTEPNKSQTQFRQELERTWDLARRLDTWARRERTSSISVKQPKKSKFETNMETASQFLM